MRRSTEMATLVDDELTVADCACGRPAVRDER